jgi:hypothetical protein
MVAKPMHAGRSTLGFGRAENRWMFILNLCRCL